MDVPFDTCEAQPKQEDRVPWVLCKDLAQSRPAHNGQIAFGVGILVLCIVLLEQYMGSTQGMY